MRRRRAARRCRPPTRSVCARSPPPPAPRRRARTDGDWLPEHEAKELLRAAGVAVPYGLAVDGEDDAVAAWRELDGPVALKLSAARVQHKTELGGVALGLDSEGDVRRAHRDDGRRWPTRTTA